MANDYPPCGYCKDVSVCNRIGCAHSANRPQASGPVWHGVQIDPASEFDQAAIDEAHAAAVEAKRQADETRDFVLERYTQLQGCLLPVEITSIQNLPGHSCLIVNDLLLLSYTEAEQMIRSIHEQ